MARAISALHGRTATRGPLTRTRPYSLELDSRTAWDFLVSASLDSDQALNRDLGPAERTWFERARESLGPERRSALDSTFGQDSPSVFHGLQTIVTEDPSVRTAADVVSLLARIEPRALVLASIEDCLMDEVPADILERASGGDRGAIDALAPSLCEEGSADAIRRFTADTRWSMDLGHAIARAWFEAFREIEPRLERIHAADIALRKRDVASLSSDDAIERITGGLRFVPDAKVRRVILAPSVFARPFNIVIQGADWRLFCYPVADEVMEPESDTPSPAMIRLFRALGDPTRLQVLRLLTSREWYLTELATQLELSKPTMKHHLALLRAAGLVTVIEEGGLTYYQLRRERLEEGGSELRRYLG